MPRATRTVAFLTPLYFDEASCLGGGERYATNMAAGLVEATDGRYHVDLISYGPAPSRRELGPGLTLRVLEAERPRDPLDAVSWELPGAIAGADLVHVHMAFSRSGEFGLLAAKQQRKPTCTSDHGGHSSWLGASLGSLELADRRRAGQVGAFAQRAEPVDDVGVHLQRRLRGLDLEDDRRVVGPQGLHGLLVVDLQAPTDDLLIDVIQTVLAEGTGAEAILGVLEVGDAEVEDLDDVERLAQHLGLLGIAGQAVEHQRGMPRDEHLLQAEDLDVPLPDADGQLVGHEQAARGVTDDLAAELAVLGKLAEQVAAGDVDDAGQLAEHGALRPLAAAGHAEE